MLQRGFGDVSHTHIYALSPSYSSLMFLSLSSHRLPSSLPFPLSPSPAVIQLAMEDSANPSDAAVLKALGKKERALRRQAEEDAKAQALHEQASGTSFWL